MKYKAIILDLDGTTVMPGEKNLPSSRVMTAITRAKKKIHVCVATGRPFFSAQPLIDHLGLVEPSIIYNGVQIYDTKHKKMIVEFQLDIHVLKHIENIVKEQHISEIYFFDGIKEKLLNIKKLPKKVLGIYLPKVEPNIAHLLAEKLKRSISSINVHITPSWTKGLLAVDITSKAASKQHGVSKVSELLNIKKEELIGVGDSYNDFPLLMACGLKVAMGNAVKELKDIADFIAPSVDDDGVAVVIEKFILDQ
ncbi:HAD family hydrolase [Patescibacteria group bacterium]